MIFYEFFQTEAVDNYFLGSIVLIKDENKPYADVIDGQQRLNDIVHFVFCYGKLVSYGGLSK